MRVLIIMVLAAALVAVSCKKAELIKTRSAIKKSIPKPALLPPPEYTYYSSSHEQDGDVYSVYGLHQHVTELINKRIKVKGRVKQAFLCKGNKKVCPKKPYLVVRDVKLPGFTMYVASANDKGLWRFPIGEEVVFEGMIIQFTSDGRLFRSEGIIVIDGGEDEPVPEEEPAEGADSTGKSGAVAK